MTTIKVLVCSLIGFERILLDVLRVTIYSIPYGTSKHCKNALTTCLPNIHICEKYKVCTLCIIVSLISYHFFLYILSLAFGALDNL